MAETIDEQVMRGTKRLPAIRRLVCSGCQSLRFREALGDDAPVQCADCGLKHTQTVGLGGDDVYTPHMQMREMAREHGAVYVLTYIKAGDTLPS